MNKLLKRFESGFKYGKPNSCWIWSKGKDDEGYGVIKIEGKSKKAHRTAYELFVGPIPEKLLVCHSCDNPSCVNPAHLFLGTSKDNTQDMIQKGRDRLNVNPPKGERNGLSKLTEEQVKWIREVYSPRHPVFGGNRLCEILGVSYSTIMFIVHNRNWKHVS